jgi:hypothetical protein
MNSLKAYGEQDGPSASNILLTAHRIQQHSEWQAKGAPLAAAKDFDTLLRQNWIKLFELLAASIEEFRSVYEKAFSSRLEKVMCWSMYGRSMFNTNSGLFVLGQLESKTGDKVWLLAGGGCHTFSGPPLMPMGLTSLLEIATFMGSWMKSSCPKAVKMLKGRR